MNFLILSVLGGSTALVLAFAIWACRDSAKHRPAPRAGRDRNGDAAVTRVFLN